MMKIAGIYLAGGNSKRMKMNQSKLALPVGNQTLGSLALETVLQSALETVFVIVQENDDVSWLPETVKKHPKCQVIHCSNAHLGQAETLRSGVQTAKDAGIDAVIIFLADQPFITIRIINRVIDYLNVAPESKFIATTYEGVIYPPVLFKKELFNELLKLNGDRGAKALLKADFLTIGTMLPCTDAQVIFDVDTKDDFQQLLRFKGLVAENSIQEKRSPQ